MRRAFTLIELLIVVAIIAILAAIAVPNFLEAQTRSKVSRALSDMRSIKTGLESYRVDFNDYPEGTDNPAKMAPEYVTFFGPLAPGYYALAVRQPGKVTGRDFATLTTPIAYISSMPEDVFVQQLGGRVAYAYRNAKDRKNGYVLTSFGPDGDALAANGRGTTNPNPLSTASDTNAIARLGDVNERAVIHYYEKSNATIVNAVDARGGLRAALADLAYDPTNGSISDGDLIMTGP